MENKDRGMLAGPTGKGRRWGRDGERWCTWPRGVDGGGDGGGGGACDVCECVFVKEARYKE